MESCWKWCVHLCGCSLRRPAPAIPGQTPVIMISLPFDWMCALVSGRCPRQHRGHRKAADPVKYLRGHQDLFSRWPHTQNTATIRRAIPAHIPMQRAPHKRQTCGILLKVVRPPVWLQSPPPRPRNPRPSTRNNDFVSLVWLCVPMFGGALANTRGHRKPADPRKCMREHLDLFSR